MKLKFWESKNKKDEQIKELISSNKYKDGRISTLERELEILRNRNIYTVMVPQGDIITLKASSVSTDPNGTVSLYDYADFAPSTVGVFPVGTVVINKSATVTE